MPSVLAGAGAAAVLAVCARRWTDARGTLLAGLLVAVQPILVGQAREARAYALLLFLGSTSWWLWLRLREAGVGSRADRDAGVGQQQGLWPAYILASTAMLYSHVFGLFFLAGQFVAGAWMPRRTWMRITAAQAGAVLLFLPWFGTLLQRAGYVSSGFWIAKSDWASLGGTLLFLGGTWALAAHVPAWLAVIWKRPRLPADAWRTLAIWTLAPIALPYAVSFVVPVYTPRYAMAAAGGYLILLAAAVTALPRTWRIGLAVALVSAGALGCMPLAGLDQELTRQDWRGAAAYVDSHAGAGDVVLFLPGYCDSNSTTDLSCAWGHYGHRTDLDLIPVGDPNVGIRDDTAGEVARRVGNATSVWFLDATRPGDPGSLQAQAWLTGAGLSGEAPVEFARLRVTHYTRTP